MVFLIIDTIAASWFLIFFDNLGTYSTMKIPGKLHSILLNRTRLHICLLPRRSSWRFWNCRKNRVSKSSIDHSPPASYWYQNKEGCNIWTLLPILKIYSLCSLHGFLLKYISFFTAVKKAGSNIQLWGCIYIAVK